MVSTGHHEVDQGHAALRRFEQRFQHQVAIAVFAGGRSGDGGGGRDQEPAMVLVTDQGGQAGATIEPRPAQPVDAAVAANKRRGHAVADDGVILDR